MRSLLKCMLVAVSFGAAASIQAQYRQEPGHSLGKVTTQGNLIVLTLDEDVLGKPTLFDLDHHTLRFTPDGSKYRIENLPLQWDSEYGPAMTGGRVDLKSVAFPFSGKSWTAFSVGMTGSITFGDPAPNGGGRRGGGGGGQGAGLQVERFAELRQAGATIINTVPAISVFFKPRMSGTRYVKELSDRVVVTWSLSEPAGGVQDWTWTPTVNRFQAVLHKDGSIDLSYNDVAARDAIVGIYPVVSSDEIKPLASLPVAGSASVAANLDIKKIDLASVDGIYLKATLETRGPLLAESDPGIAGLSYRICLDLKKPTGPCSSDSKADAIWTITGGGGRGRGQGGGGMGGGGGMHYNAVGEGVTPGVKLDGNTISLQGTLPPQFKPGAQVFVSAAVQTPGTPPVVVAQVAPQAVKLTGFGSPELDLSSVKKQDGPFSIAYETFHYMRPTRANDLTCSVINALGDNFDMLAFYSDFRIDNPEAGTSSTGPLGGGPNGGAVTGIGANQRNLASYCTKGRFQWQFIQPVYVGANQMQEYPPAGFVDNNIHDVAAYSSQLEERTANGKIPPYDYAMSQIGHEMGHRWSAFVSAKVGNETIQLGPTHWARGLQAPAPFPYQRPTEASAMGGGVWQDNYDGTFTQLDDDYYVPATGYSYLDLYLMGMITASEVPDFFILRNMVPAGRDANGHPIFKADRTKVTINDVIAVEGPRLPAPDKSQRNFNTGMVVVVEHGKTPSPELIERTNGIAARWSDYWTTTTGHRATMTTNPK